MTRFRASPDRPLSMDSVSGLMIFIQALMKGMPKL